MIRPVYKVKILTLSIQHLLKIDCESHCTLFFTIAFWTIYKLIVKRNITGIDKRKVASKQNFHREITRLESKSNKDDQKAFTSIIFMLIMIQLLCKAKLNFNFVMTIMFL